jgi:hypothetical protein
MSAPPAHEVARYLVSTCATTAHRLQMVQAGRLIDSMAPGHRDWVA